MKKAKKVLIVVFVIIAIVLSIITGLYLINKSEIELNNRVAFYVQEFLKNTPKSDTVLTEVDNATAEFLAVDAYDNGFYFSKFHKKYITDAFWLDNNSNEKHLIKNQYFNEVIMLRLKVLAYQGNAEAYHKLFDTYIYDIESNLYTNVRFVSLFINDEKHPVSYNSELFEIIETSFVGAYDNCNDVTTKFYLLNEIVQFYGNFKECSNKEELYRKELVELINNNKAVLQDTISEVVQGTVSVKTSSKKG